MNTAEKISDLYSDDYIPWTNPPKCVVDDLTKK